MLQQREASCRGGGCFPAPPPQPVTAEVSWMVQMTADRYGNVKLEVIDGPRPPSALQQVTCSLDQQSSSNLFTPGAPSIKAHGNVPSNELMLDWMTILPDTRGATKMKV